MPQHAPYDRIIVTVGAWDIPPTWSDQLAEGGWLVVPLRMRGLTRSIVFEREGDYDAAIGMLDDSSTPDPWEEAVATCLRTLCLRIGNQPADTSAAAMVSAYLRLEPSREHRVFRTRLGPCVIDLAADTHRAATSQVIARVIREAVAGADAYSASDVLSHEPCRSSMAQADEDALAAIIELSGLRRGTMPADLLDDLMTSAKTSGAQLAQVLARDTHHPSTA